MPAEPTTPASPMPGALHVRSPQGAQEEWLGDLCAFCTTHPADFPPDVVERILTGLVRGPDAVLEVCDQRGWPHGRLAVAAVVDTCKNRDESADLPLLGQVAPGLDQAGIRALVAAAEECTRRGPLTQLDIGLSASKSSWAPCLEALGYGHGYTAFTMKRPAHVPLAEARAPLPANLRWQPLDMAHIRDYHRVVSLAFSTIPGALMPPVEEYERALRRLPEPPLVLMDGERVRAYLQTHLQDTGSGPLGELRSLGRDPALRGLGLGDHLVRRGISDLVARGATRLQLTVAAENSAALALYERHGFTVAQRIVTLRRRL